MSYGDYQERLSGNPFLVAVALVAGLAAAVGLVGVLLLRPRPGVAPPSVGDVVPPGTVPPRKVATVRPGPQAAPATPNAPPREAPPPATKLEATPADLARHPFWRAKVTAEQVEAMAAALVKASAGKSFVVDDRGKHYTTGPGEESVSPDDPRAASVTNRRAAIDLDPTAAFIRLDRQQVLARLLDALGRAEVMHGP
jgi:hypothetical protein